MTSIHMPDGIQTISVSELKPYKKNARTHSEYQIEKLVKSMQTFGFTNPIIIDEDNVIIAGHGRLEASKILKLEEVPYIQLTHLTETEKKALVLADNRIAEDANWDMEMVKMELSEIQMKGFDIELTGFTVEDLKIDFSEGSEDDQGNFEEKEAKTVECPECGKKFTP